MNVRTNLVLPEELIAEVDQLAGPRGRSRYVAEALEQAVRRDRLLRVIDRTAGAWANHPLWKTDADVVDWVRKLRAQDRDPWTGNR